MIDTTIRQINQSQLRDQLKEDISIVNRVIERPDSYKNNTGFDKLDADKLKELRSRLQKERIGNDTDPNTEENNKGTRSNDFSCESNPVFAMKVNINGLLSGNPQEKIQEIINMLNTGNQNIVGIKTICTNAKGRISGALIEHSPDFPVNSAVMSQSSKTGVITEGLFSGNPCNRVKDTIKIIQSSERMVTNVDITGYNNQGKITSVMVYHISKHKYDSLMNRT